VKLDIVFRGCTRPQLVMGVPMIPVLLAFGLVVLLCMWFTGKLVVLLPIFYVIMRAMVKIDEHIFDLLALRLRIVMKTVPNAKSKNGDLIIGPHNFNSPGDR
jgi:type IV secretion system protein VirB3